MKAAPRLLIQLVPSHWQRRLGVCCALFLGIAVGLVAHDLVPGHSWLLSVALAAIATVAFTLIAHGQNARLGTEQLCLILAQAGQVWIGHEGAPPLDMPMPELSRLQRYLGLIWLRNSAGMQVLIWPDSVSADDHRQLRVWLGIYAHRKN